METLEILQVIWFFLIGVLFIGYSILDGFDLGIGTLLPFLSKNENDTRALFNSIGPVWDGNEVWLLTAGGAMFAAFPYVYATVFSGFYLALMLVLFALIFRAVSLEFWSLEETGKEKWKWSFILGSALPSLLFGVALGNVIIGIPLNDKMDFTGNFFTLLRPFPLSIGLLGLAAIMLQGTTYASVKTYEDMQTRARELSKKIWFFYMFALLLAGILSMIYLTSERANILAWVSTACVIISLVANRLMLNKKNDIGAFIASSISFVCLWCIAGALQFPSMVKASNGTNFNLTIYNSSSSELTLKIMLLIVIIGMPLVLGYTIYVYKIFKGKVS